MSPGAGMPHTGHDRRSLRERAERRLYRAWKGVRQRLPGGLPRSRLFVAGLQRSGTNMLMETLEWSPHTDVYHETDARAFAHYEMRDVETIHALAARSPAPLFVIKSLCELDRIRSLLDSFAPARAVWIVRHYHDSANSAVRSFANFAAQLQRLATDKDSDGWRGRGMSDATQALLAEVAALQPDELNAAAMMWYYRNVLFFEQDLQHDPRVALIFYEDLVRDPAARLQALFGFLELPGFSPWVTRYIHASSVRRSQPPRLLPEVETACAGLMQRFAGLPRL